MNSISYAKMEPNLEPFLVCVHGTVRDTDAHETKANPVHRSITNSSLAGHRIVESEIAIQ